MLEKQRQQAAMRNKQRMTGGIMMTDAGADPAAAAVTGVAAGRTTTVSRGGPRAVDVGFDESRQSRG